MWLIDVACVPRRQKVQSGGRGGSEGTQEFPAAGPAPLPRRRRAVAPAAVLFSVPCSLLYRLEHSIATRHHTGKEQAE